MSDLSRQMFLPDLLNAALVMGTTRLVDGGAHLLSYPDTGKIRAEAARPGPDTVPKP